MSDVDKETIENLLYEFFAQRDKGYDPEMTNEDKEKLLELGDQYGLTRKEEPKDFSEIKDSLSENKNSIDEEE